jgi:hypothetical protein
VGGSSPVRGGTISLAKAQRKNRVDWILQAPCNDGAKPNRRKLLSSLAYFAPLRDYHEQDHYYSLLPDIPTQSGEDPIMLATTADAYQKTRKIKVTLK